VVVMNLCKLVEPKMDDWDLIPSRRRDFFLHYNVHTGSGAHSTFHWVLGWNSWIVKLTAHLHLVPRLRICGVLPPLSL